MSITKKISLEEAFQIFTVAELKELCKKAEISGVSSKKKAEIIKVLVEKLMDITVFRKFALFATDEELNALKKAFTHSFITEEDEGTLYYWLQNGYCFMDDRNQVLVMSEVKKLYQNLGDEFWLEHERFHLLYSYIEAAVHLYGVITIQAMTELFNRYNEVKTSRSEILHLYQKLDQRTELMDFDIEEEIIMDEILLDAEDGYFAFEVVYEQQGTCPFYYPKKEDLLKFYDEDYYEKPKEYDVLLDYLFRVYDIHKAIAEDMCDEIMHSIHLGYLVDDIMTDLEQKGVSIDPFHKEDLTNLILELINHTRSIFYRGFTPAEVGKEIAGEVSKRHSGRFVYQGKPEKLKGSKVIPFPGAKL